ncbi:ParA family protein [Komagataeibacter rhaeticus]|uniref:ParA family protein n=1 Tax=Komagataeibacter rhaeticus TaxID=215221 RepID=UPI000A05E352|nr:ParA family protein [Komagataeibacter rhaeticus]
MPKVILVSSPKGGSGKSVIARHLLVAAAQEGMSVIGVDYDRQGTLDKWAQRRERTLESFPSFAPVKVIPSTLQNWRSGLKAAQSADLVVLDTPPSVEDHMAAITGLAQSADLVIVPSVCTQDDADSVAPWSAVLKNTGCKSVLVLNRANRRTNSFAKIRGRLIKVADVCPIELPQLEDVHVPSAQGLTLLDFTKSRGQEAFEELWAFTKRIIEK